MHIQGRGKPLQRTGQDPFSALSLVDDVILFNLSNQPSHKLFTKLTKLISLCTRVARSLESAKKIKDLYSRAMESPRNCDLTMNHSFECFCRVLTDDIELEICCRCCQKLTLDCSSEARMRSKRPWFPKQTC